MTKDDNSGYSGPGEFQVPDENEVSYTFEREQKSLFSRIVGQVIREYRGSKEPIGFIRVESKEEFEWLKRRIENFSNQIIYCYT